MKSRLKVEDLYPSASVKPPQVWSWSKEMNSARWIATTPIFVDISASCFTLLPQVLHQVYRLPHLPVYTFSEFLESAPTVVVSGGGTNIAEVIAFAKKQGYAEITVISDSHWGQNLDGIQINYISVLSSLI